MVPHLASLRSRPARLLAGAAAGLTALGVVSAGVAVAPASWAGTCSSKTGGSTNTVMWTGTSYTCAYEADNGNNKIGSWNTESFTSSTAMGYEKRYSCSGRVAG